MDTEIKQLYQCRNCEFVGVMGEDFEWRITKEKEVKTKPCCKKCGHVGALDRVSLIPKAQDLIEQIISKQYIKNFVHIDSLRGALIKMAEGCLNEAAYMASYKGGLSKAEIWSVGQDELCDKIEELILNLKNTIV